MEFPPLLSVKFEAVEDGAVEGSAEAEDSDRDTSIEDKVEPCEPSIDDPGGRSDPD